MDIYHRIPYNRAVMTYEETLRHIYALGRFGIKPGLERITSLLKNLGSPEERTVPVLVAGTNGKGSTASFLASILASGGVRVGLYTSPHLVSFTERIRINGAEIAPAAVTRLAGRVLAAAPAGATFFEIVTAMALLHFAEERVEIAVLEAGMGGRFDATNAAPASLAVITPVSIDHAEYLGESVAAIAAEKAGIVRKGQPVVAGPQLSEAAAVIEERCREAGAHLYCHGRDFAAHWEGECLDYRGISMHLSGLRPGIGGRFQAENAATALAAAEILGGKGFDLTAAVCAAGIESASWPGRMEVLGASPRVILDGAHNPAAVAALVASLATVPRERLFLVVGIMADKDVGELLRPLLPLASQVFAVAPALPRALASAELALRCKAAGAACIDAGSVTAGLARAREEAGPDDVVLVTGSLFTVGEARAALLSLDFEPFRG